MDALLERFSGRIDAKMLIDTVDEIKRDYLADGLTKEDIPGILGKLIPVSSKFKKLSGQDKKKLVIGVLNHLIEQIDAGEEDSELETTLKTMVPPMIDALAGMIKLKNKLCPCL
jgi:hypothetical protein